ncbi:MAG: hypothetical protein ACOY45_10655 [Pseudomonadota bacterium]
MRQIVPIALSFVVLGASAPAPAPAIAAPQDVASLEAMCRKNEISVPESCGCTVERTRKAGIADGDLVSLFRDDGRRQPVAQATYNRFWEVKTQCVTEAVNAKFGIPTRPGAPVPPRVAGQPPVAVPPVAPPAPPVASEPPPRVAAPAIQPVPPRQPAAAPASRYFQSRGPAEAALRALSGTAWEWRDPESSQHRRIEFLPGKVLGWEEDGGKFVTAYRVAVLDNGSMLLIGVADGRVADQEFGYDGKQLVLHHRYVRTGETDVYRKVSPRGTLPPGAPRPIGDSGYWLPNYISVAPNPTYEKRTGLARFRKPGLAIHSADFAVGGAYPVLARIRPTAARDCSGGCQYVFFDNPVGQPVRWLTDFIAESDVAVSPQVDASLRDVAQVGRDTRLRLAVKGPKGWTESMECGGTPMACRPIANPRVFDARP